MINNSSKSSHIIFINYLDLDQAFTTHKIRFRINQNHCIQNSGEFKVENKVLERNYGRATFHHFHIRVYSRGLF